MHVTNSKLISILNQVKEEKDTDKKSELEELLELRGAANGEEDCFSDLAV